MRIEGADQGDHGKIMQIWDASVRATHDFLTEQDRVALQPVVAQYLSAVELSVAKDSDTILGFCGVSPANATIEMLFVAPSACGRGIGAALVRHAVNVQGACKVDVNEQNVSALGFYRHMGFRVVGRSATDGQGKPYPLLHMQLSARH